MKRVASATERDMLGWGIGGCWCYVEVQVCTKLRDVGYVNVNVEILARRNSMSLRDDEVDFFSYIVIWTIESTNIIVSSASSTITEEAIG